MIYGRNLVNENVFGNVDVTYFRVFGINIFPAYQRIIQRSYTLTRMKCVFLADRLRLVRKQTLILNDYIFFFARCTLPMQIIGNTLFKSPPKLFAKRV